MKETISVLRASSLGQLHEALASTKANCRTPLILASEESNIKTKSIVQALGSDVRMIHLRDLAFEVTKVPYDERQKYIEKKYKYGKDMLHKMIVGEK